MPNRTVYIKPEDLPLWESIENKSAFIHLALIPHYGVPPAEAMPVVMTASIDTKEDALAVAEAIAPHVNYLKKGKTKNGTNSRPTKSS